MAAREVLIIRRLQTVIKLPVTKIALAVNRNKTTVYEGAAWSVSGSNREKVSK